MQQNQHNDNKFRSHAANIVERQTKTKNYMQIGWNEGDHRHNTGCYQKKCLVLLKKLFQLQFSQWFCVFMKLLGKLTRKSGWGAFLEDVYNILRLRNTFHSLKQHKMLRILFHTKNSSWAFGVAMKGTKGTSILKFVSIYLPNRPQHRTLLFKIALKKYQKRIFGDRISKKLFFFRCMLTKWKQMRVTKLRLTT